MMENLPCYINARQPTEKRLIRCDGAEEHHLTEGAVMIALAMYLFDMGATHLRLCPDGTHGQIHDMKATLKLQGFELINPQGSTSYGGDYKRGGQTLIVKATPGVGDVSAEINGKRYVAECKGGIINTSHSGQISRLRRGLCEAIGQLMSRDESHEIHLAVVPDTPTTRSLAQKMRDRVARAGIKIALVNATGEVYFP